MVYLRQLREEGARRSGGIGCGAKGRDDGNAMCASAENLGHLLGGNPPDREEGQRALRYRLTQTAEPLRLPIFGFARRGIDRPENQEISPGRRGNFFRVVSRYADQFPRAQEPTGNGDRTGRLPEVHSVSFYRQSDIHTIVDQQARLVTSS